MAKYEYLNKSGVHNYASASNWLDGARTKNATERPLYQLGLKLRRVSEDEIVIIGWNSLTLMSYLADGTIVLGNGTVQPWPWVRRVWMTFTLGMQVFVKKHIVYISSPADGVTPDNIKYCRSCDGYGKVNGYCWGPNRCEDTECEINQHKQKLLDSGVHWSDTKIYALKHLVHDKKCSHNKEKMHVVKRVYPCRKCNETGKYNYGGKRIARPLTSKLIKLNKNLEYIDIDEWEDSTNVYSS